MTPVGLVEGKSALDSVISPEVRDLVLFPSSAASLKLSLLCVERFKQRELPSPFAGKSKDDVVLADVFSASWPKTRS